MNRKIEIFIFMDEFNLQLKNLMPDCKIHKNEFS